MKQAAWAVSAVVGMSLAVGGCGPRTDPQALQVLQPLKLPIDRRGLPDRTAIPWPVPTDDFQDPGWIDGRLTAYKTGPGVAVCEPSGEGPAAAFGRGAARWLQVALSSQKALERMPTFTSVTKALERGPIPFALTPALAKRLSVVTGATHAVTTRAAGSGSQIQLALQLYSLADTKAVGAPLRLEGSADQVAERLPTAVNGLLSALGAKVEGALPKAEPAGTLRVVGSVPRITWVDPAQVGREAIRLAKTSDLAALMLIETSAMSGDQRLAEEILAELPARARENPALWAAAGRASLLLGFEATPEDLAGCLAVLKAHPRSYLAHVAAAAIWSCAQQPAEATAHAAEAVRCNPSGSEGWRILGEHLSVQADMIRRGRYYRRLDSEEVDGLEPLYRGWARAARKSTEIDPGGSGNWLQYAMGATFASDTVTAEKALWRAMKLRPLSYSVVAWGLNFYSPNWRDNPQMLRRVQEAAASEPLGSARDRELVLASLRQYSRFDLVRKMSGAPPPRRAATAVVPPEAREEPAPAARPAPAPRSAPAPRRIDLATRRKQLDELAAAALRASGADLEFIEPEAPTQARSAPHPGSSGPAPESVSSLGLAAEAPPIPIRGSAVGKAPPDASRVLARSPHTLFALAWDRAGRRLAAGGKNGTLFILDAAGKRTDLKGHAGTVYGVAWSPSGAALASCGADGTIRIWDAASGKAGVVLKGHSGPVRSVDWSPRGELASAGDDRTVRLWDVAAGAQLRRLAGHSRLAGGVAFSPDGRRLFSTSVRAGMGEGIVWDAATGKLLRKLQVSPGFLQSIAWSPDGRSVAVAQRSNIVVLDPDSGTLVKSAQPERGYAPISLLWEEGCGLVAGLGNRKLRTVQPGAHPLPDSISTGDSLPTAIAWNPKTNRLATAQNNGLVREWTVAAEGGGQ